jgi:hypothetical protein
MSTDRTLQDDVTDNLQTTIGVITTTFTWKTNIVLLHHQTSRTLYDALIQNYLHIKCCSSLDTVHSNL